LRRDKLRRAFSRVVLGALAGALVVTAAGAPPVAARPTSTPFFFSTGNPDGLMAMASRQTNAAGGVEIEAADDFVLSAQTTINGGSFAGLLAGGAMLADVSRVAVEIYRVFPSDSTNPPSGQVPTRVNSPSDVAFSERSTDAGDMTAVGAVVTPSFTTNNSILNGIHPLPNVTTGGEGAVTGVEVTFNLSFTTPLSLPAGHYFFVPQVQLAAAGEFYWLSAPKPIVPPGTSFSPDLQAWIRNADLDPDWLRAGTDIVGGQAPPNFNGTFTLAGSVPTAVTVASFDAVRTRAGVRVRWRTGAENGLLGFVVLRERNGATSRIGPTLIPASGSTLGRAYTLMDRAAPNGSVRYWLRVVTVRGSASLYGPAVARARPAKK
jgi:hypothetical protein